MRWLCFGAAAMMASACGGKAVVGGGEGGSATVPTIEPTCLLRVETTGIVDGVGVAREDCLAAFAFPTPIGPSYNVEYWFDTGSQPVFIGQGEAIVDDGVPAALDVGIFEALQPLATEQPLCAGPGSTMLRRDRDAEESRVELHLESLSRLGPCPPGDDWWDLQPATETIASSFGGESELLRVDSSASGQLRIYDEDSGYAFADVDLELPAPSGEYTVLRAFVYDDGELFCGGGGTVEIGSNPDPDTSPIERISITGLGSAGTCPGEPVGGFVDIREVNETGW